MYECKILHLSFDIYKLVNNDIMRYLYAKLMIDVMISLQFIRILIHLSTILSSFQYSIFECVIFVQFSKKKSLLFVEFDKICPLVTILVFRCNVSVVVIFELIIRCYRNKIITVTAFICKKTREMHL